MGNKFDNWLNEHLLGPMGKMANFRFVRAIMAAGLASIPFTIVGSMMLVLNVIPMAFPATASFWNATFVKITPLYMSVNYATMGALALYFNIVLGYEYTRIISTEDKVNMSPINGALLSVFAFFMTLIQIVTKHGKMVALNTKLTDGTHVMRGFHITDSGLDRLGTGGIFVGIIMAVIAVKIYELAVKKNWVIKMPKEVPAGVAAAFTALIPGFLIGFVVMILEGVLIACGTDVFDVISLPFSFVGNLTDTWLGILVIEFTIHGLWFMGIHGANIVSAFINPILMNNFAENFKGAHHIFAGEFNNMFVIIGGSGATLGIVIWMTLRARSSQLKVLSRTALVPAFFNINEPIIFGAPIVYNPYLLIPFIFAPMVTASTTYFAIKFDIVHKIIAQMPWPSPVGAGAFIGTGGDWKAAILAVINVVLAFVIWYPFMKAYDNKLYNDEHAKKVAAEQK
ncbi:PTS cellobiose transporter subunit IIC [Limosilactobacillus secaliphilus]|uniref:Permease IIC component n=1 Tax=Limosilactobacillus secaliphilus TaxID=396268 RepID=A0A0R2HZX7_9LACO|nr:PTS cellobiose transporter subunit IIC [Limosilactobacillus secaliphilus]KRN58264.1 PTS system, cellobiose-specific IIC component [Limosilactobacillus secaliphilus]